MERDHKCPLTVMSEAPTRICRVYICTEQMEGVQQYEKKKKTTPHLPTLVPRMMISVKPMESERRWENFDDYDEPSPLEDDELDDELIDKLNIELDLDWRHFL
ncbi:hypothetical protein J3F83DRAFT_617572 [Trichoderma novae-zelandiae]